MQRVVPVKGHLVSTCLTPCLHDVHCSMSSPMRGRVLGPDWASTHRRRCSPIDAFALQLLRDTVELALAVDVGWALCTDCKSRNEQEAEQQSSKDLNLTPSHDSRSCWICTPKLTHLCSPCKPCSAGQTRSPGLLCEQHHPSLGLAVSSVCCWGGVFRKRAVEL